MKMHERDEKNYLNKKERNKKIRIKFQWLWNELNDAMLQRIQRKSNRCSHLFGCS